MARAAGRPSVLRREVNMTDGATQRELCALSTAVSTARGTVTLPVVITAIPDRVVWLPTNSAGSAVRATLGADSGAVVSVAAVPVAVATGIDATKGA